MQAVPRTAEDGRWRLLSPAPLGAASHLARSQAILEAVGAGRAPGTVAFECWPELALILGTAQPAADLDQEACRRHGIAIARRLAGGTAVLATPDYLSFTIVLPVDHALVHDNLFTAYARLGEPVLDALRRLGVPARLLSVAEARARATPAALRPLCYGGFSPYEMV